MIHNARAWGVGVFIKLDAASVRKTCRVTCFIISAKEVVAIKRLPKKVNRSVFGGRRRRRKENKKMALIPDPRGLWVQAFIGMVFLNDNYFYPFFVFLVVHYLIVWQTMGVVAAPDLMQWEFIGRMAFIYFWGAVAGIAASIAMRTRPLIPGHTFHRGAVSLGLFLATVAIFTGIRSVMILTGQTRVAAPFDPDPADTATQVIYGIVIAISAIGFIAVVALTYADRKVRDVWSWFAIRYIDDFYNSYIVDYIVALVLILSPQALWDFLVLPPTNWPQLPAGGLTIFVELLVWVAIYAWFTFFRRINTTHFSSQRSIVSFGYFCLFVGGTQIANGIYYLILAEFLTGTVAAEQVLAGFMGIVIVASVILYFVFNNMWIVRKAQLKQASGSSDTERSGSARWCQPVPQPRLAWK